MNITEPDSGAGEDILIVDNTKTNLQLLSDILSDAGYKVRPASTGELALRSVKKKPPDLILLDIKMPGMDGFEVCRQLKANERTCSIPIIFISVLEDERSKVKGFQAGAVDYVNKPFYSGEVLARVKTHLSINRLQLNLKSQNAQLLKEITERKRVEETLRESEERFRTVFEDAATGIALMGKDGYFLKVNQTLCRILGYSEEELMGKTWVEITEPDDLNGCFDCLKRVKAGEQSAYEKRFIHKLGYPLWVMVSSSVIRDSRDQIRYYISLFQDISKRKEVEEALRESEKNFRTLVERLPAITYSAALDESSTTLFVSPQIEEKLGISPEKYKVVPDFWVKHLHDEDRERVLREVSYAHETGQPFISEYRMISADGRLLWFRDEAVIIKDDEGIPINLQGVMFDITERKRMEEELLRAQKLESLGVFAGGIAHDFNNILTTILGNVSMAKMEVSCEGEMFDLLNEAEMASTRAQMLTKQLLTFAKGGAPVKEIASIKAILKESSSFVLRGSKSGCEFSIAENLWPAEVDVGQISKVINNIVINANQAMPKGGTIQVASDNLIIDDGNELLIKPGRYIRISITDQGVGIAQKHLLNIFDPYFTTKQEGSGLGLATAYSIVKKHDGQITVESQLEVGTTFHIYLPASEKAVPEKEKARLIKGQGRILVMDDEASLRKMVGRMLKNLGYESEVAKDGAEAVRMVKQAKEAEKSYDAVILDLTVPGGMGGKEAIDKLLEIDPEIKAIVSSGYSDDPVLANFQEYGFKGMMPKPFESLSLSKVLHEVLKGKGIDL